MGEEALSVNSSNDNIEISVGGGVGPSNSHAMTNSPTTKINPSFVILSLLMLALTNARICGGGTICRASERRWRLDNRQRPVHADTMAGTFADIVKASLPGFPISDCLGPSNAPCSTRAMVVSLTNAVNHPIILPRSSSFQATAQARVVRHEPRFPLRATRKPAR